MHFSAHSINSWRELSALESLDRSPDEDWIRGVGFDLQAPSHSVTPLQPVTSGKHAI